MANNNMLLILGVIAIVLFMNQGTQQVSEVGQLKHVETDILHGMVEATYTTGEYKLVAIMSSLPDPGEGMFYEGWVITGDTKTSTGKATKEGNIWTNIFISSTDFSERDIYVLTIETTDDGQPETPVLKGLIEYK